MNIDRQNYEEYFILYLDNELSNEQRRMVESFVQLHPDLKEELDLLKQFKLVPDPSVIYAGKQELLKINGGPVVSTANAEEWMILYHDNELSVSQRKEVEELILANPFLQPQFSLLQKSKLAPESLVYPDKASLYRHEEKVRAIPAKWWRAAAVIIFTIGLTGFFLLNNKSGNDTPGAVAETPSKKKTNTIVPEQLPLPQQEMAVTDKIQITDPVINDKQVVKQDKPVHSTPLVNKSTMPDPGQLQSNENVIAEVKNPPSNNLPQPEYKSIQDNVIKNTLVKNEIPKQIITTDDPVTNRVSNPSDIHTASLINEDLVDENSSKKNKLRGFFRKVTRTFEKRTNIEATDDDDRLLVGGVAIRLK